MSKNSMATSLALGFGAVAMALGAAALAVAIVALGSGGDTVPYHTHDVPQHDHGEGGLFGRGLFLNQQEFLAMLANDSWPAGGGVTLWEGPGEGDAGAVTRVEQAMALYDLAGREAVIDRYSGPAALDGSWYVAIADAETAEIVAHPNLEVIGESLYGPVGTDSTGFNHGAVLAQVDERGEWVEYLFLNPESGREEPKRTWAQRRGDLIFASGWYSGRE